MIYTKIALVSNQMKSVHKIFDLLTISNLTIFRRTWYANFIILIFDMVSDMVKMLAFTDGPDGRFDDCFYPG